MLIKNELSSRNLWMFPRNQRDLWPYEIKMQLQVLRSVVGKESWSQNNQDQFIDELERWDLKKGEPTQVTNTGGARTYLARYELLGLTFINKKLNVPYLTIAGEAIADGENPLEVLRHQLLSMQFPTPYSQGSGVKMNSEISVKPVQFILKLLSDSSIGTLSESETIFAVVYGHNNGCLEFCKKKIQEFRALGIGDENKETQCNAISTLIDNYQDLETPRTIKTPEEEERKYIFRRINSDIKDIANTLKCYMEGPGLISINEDEKHYKYFLSPEVRLWVEERNKKYSLEKIEDFDESVSEEFFQRRYGRYTYQKDTRQIKGLTQSYQLKSEKDFVTSKFYGYLQASNEDLDSIPSGFISLMEEQFGLNRSVVREHLLSVITPDAIDSHLRELSVGGGELNAINFEKYLSSWLKENFQISARHIGQLTDSDGKSNADVLVWDLKLSACGLMDAKAYSSGYSLPLADRLKMMHVYQYSCLDMRSGEEELQCVGYVCGTIGNNANLEHHLEEIKSTIGKPAFMIQIDELIDVKNKYDGSPASLFDFFKKGGVLDSTMFNSAV